MLISPKMTQGEISRILYGKIDFLKNIIFYADHRLPYYELYETVLSIENDIPYFPKNITSNLRKLKYVEDQLLIIKLES
jgi:hypothetical protein